MCHQNSIMRWPENSFHQATRCVTEAFSTTCAVHIEDCGDWWLSKLSGRAPPVQARECPGIDSWWLLAFSLSPIFSSSKFLYFQHEEGVLLIHWWQAILCLYPAISNNVRDYFGENCRIFQRHEYIRESVDSLCRDGADAQYMQYLRKSCITSTQLLY